MPSTLLLFSGGLDSTTLLAKLIKDEVEVSTLSIDYGQRHATAEMDAAHNVLDHYKPWIKSTISLPMPAWKDSSSVLVNRSAPMPDKTYQELQDTLELSPTYVPFRNGVFISHAIAIAMIRNIDTVAIAVHASDWENWAYPDCSPEFVGSMQAASLVGTYFRVRVIAPFVAMKKHQIVKVGLSIGVPYHLTWSCYSGGQKPCGTCPTCRERAEAFRMNGVEDPLN